MTEDFDKELYVKQEDVEEFIKNTEPHWKIKNITMAESLTNFVNAILDNGLKILNNKCNSCDKLHVCKIWQDLIDKNRALTEKNPKLKYTAGILSCSNYQKKGKANAKKKRL